MARWEPNAQERLAQAALELYAERGFERTTVADIAARAGLTERTYFRYFTDKREVLFAGGSAMQDALVAGCTSAPPEASPFDAVAAGLDAVATEMETVGERAAARRAIINENAELRERELMKLAAWAVALADALRARGLDDLTAGLVADAGMAVFHAGFEQWIVGGQKRPLAEEMRDAMARLRAVSAAT